VAGSLGAGMRQPVGEGAGLDDLSLAAPAHPALRGASVYTQISVSDSLIGSLCFSGLQPLTHASDFLELFLLGHGGLAVEVAFGVFVGMGGHLGRTVEVARRRTKPQLGQLTRWWYSVAP
jgi:hypothetical protein